MMMRVVMLLAVFFLAGVVVAEDTIEACIEVDQVWSGHPVGFSLLTHGERQYAAYYDSNRQMIVAQRMLTETTWHKQPLPEHVVWDSHNSVTMALDDTGCLHVSGNMHVVPLVYFRSHEPWEVTTLERMTGMTGERENRCTYPLFLRGPNNEFLFTYRDGQSGKGDQIYNLYDTNTRTWRRLLDTPLTSGKGLMNAYFNGPVKGPDGYMHIGWVWRNTFGCETNHDLSYARSRDMVHWEKSDETPLTLPITIDTAEIVDPVPPKGGIINGNLDLGFDSQGRVLITYHKYDAAGNTQVYIARREEKGWVSYQISDWDWRWAFSGGGSIVFEVGFDAARVAEKGRLTQSWWTAQHGAGTWLLDEETLAQVGDAAVKPGYPQSIRAVESPVAGMQVRWAADLGSSGEPGVRYVLRWETLPANRDKPREGTPPPPSPMRLYKLIEAK